MTRRTGTVALGRATALALVALVALGGSAVARVVTGTGKGDRLRGTAKSDTLRLKGGNDRASGRGGNDRISGAAGRDSLNGGAGNDRLNGGSGKDRLSGGRGKDRLSGTSGNDRLSGTSGNDRLDGGSGNDYLAGGSGNDYLGSGTSKSRKGLERLLGGPGNDVLNAVDRRKDVRVDGGSGRNKCILDPADLAVAKGCTKIQVVLSGGGGSGGGRSGGGGSGGGGTSPGGGVLTLTSADGLSCQPNLLGCSFKLSATGANPPVGSITAEGGVRLPEGATASVTGDVLTATGAYACTSDGLLRVVVGGEVLKLPISCRA